MSREFVVDSSIALGWVHPSQATELTRTLLDEVQGGAVFHVPSLWTIEVANALLVAVRRKLMTDPQRRAAINLLFRTSAKVDSDTADLAWTAISDLAIKYGLSVYDASYLELAVRKTLPLASRDEPLRAAARKCGVKLM